MWAILNQYQLLICLPLLKSYVSNELIYFIHEFEFAAFDFTFMDPIPYPYIDFEIEGMDYPPTDEVFADNFLESQSILVNQLGTIKTLIMTGILHLLFVSIYFCIRRSEKKWIKKARDSAFSYFHFDFYCRLIVEAYMFVLIASLNESAYPKYFSNQEISYVTAIVVSVFLGIFCIFLIVYFLATKETSPSRKYFNELYKDTKNFRFAKLFIFAFALRRFAIAMVLVFMTDFNLYAFSFIQFCAMAYFLIVRPFESQKDNLIESINEVIFFVACVLFTMSDNDGYQTFNSSIVYLMMGGGAVATIIIYADMIIQWVKKCKAKRKSKKRLTKVENLKIDPENNEESKEEMIGGVTAKKITFRF